jgi:hypothetical protein
MLVTEYACAAARDERDKTIKIETARRQGRFIGNSNVSRSGDGVE